MTKILQSCARWLRFSGVLISADIGSVWTVDHKSRKAFDCIAADVRFFWILLLCAVFLIPRVVFKKCLKRLKIITKYRQFAGRIFISSSC